MAAPFTLRKAGGGSALRGTAGDTLRGVSAGVTVVTQQVSIYVLSGATAGPPGATEV